MNRFTIALTGLILSSIASFGQIRFGVTGGAQLSHFKVESGGQSSNEDIQAGLMAGLLLDAPIAKKISIRPQLLFSAKGSKYYTGGSSPGVTSSFILNYLEIPIQLVYGVKAWSGQVVVGAGPYVAYGLSVKQTINLLNQSFENELTFGSENDQYKQFDVGIRLSVGYETHSGVLLSTYYSPSLSNLSNEHSSSLNNRTIGLALGYLFGRK